MFICVYLWFQILFNIIYRQLLDQSAKIKFSSRLCRLMCEKAMPFRVALTKSCGCATRFEA